MLKKKDHIANMGKSDHGWLKALFHFSFGEYYDENNKKFGVLRVLNDDLIAPKTGFDTHPHRDMEIVSYVIEGKLTHEDSMGNRSSITRGQVQYMSAGTGVYHSEHNLDNETIRSLQIWILPDEKGHTPNYGDYKFKWEERKNNWLHIISSKQGEAPIKINQDANFYVLELEQGNKINFPVASNRQAYLVQIEGTSMINNIILHERDALEVIEEDITILANKTSHYILIEMAKDV